MRYLLLVFCIAAGVDAYAAANFVQTWGGQKLDRGVFVSPTQDDGYIVVGTTESFGQGGEDVYLVKADSAGEILWTRTHGGAEQELGWSVHEIQDGFILAGSTKSFGEGDFDFYLVKTNPDGDSEWSKTFGGEGSDRCWALARTGDGGFILAGETTSFGAGEEDFYLVKTDSLGTEQWSRTYGGEKGDRCFSIVQAADGGYVLAGQTYSEGAGDRDVHVVKTSANGEPEWSGTYGGEASDVGHCIIATSDGCFVVTGYTTSFATAGDDPYLIKIDPQGETVWTRVLPLAGHNHTLTGDEASDGGFFLVGFTEHRDRRIKTALLVRTDPEGHRKWQRELHASDVGETIGYTVRATDDGGCVFTGHTTTDTAGGLDLYLVGVAGRGSR